MRTLFLAPHSDDETLFGAFTLLRERPHVIVCCASPRHYGGDEVRQRETLAALALLGCSPRCRFLGNRGQPFEPAFAALLAEHDELARVWAPDARTSHPDHRRVHDAARAIFGARVCTYHTYCHGERVRSAFEAPYRLPWIGVKLAALACYRSQWEHPRASQFYLDSLREYYAAPVAS